MNQYELSLEEVQARGLRNADEHGGCSLMICEFCLCRCPNGFQWRDWPTCSRCIRQPITTPIYERHGFFWLKSRHCPECKKELEAFCERKPRPDTWCFCDSCHSMRNCCLECWGKAERVCQTCRAPLAVECAKLKAWQAQKQVAIDLLYADIRAHQEGERQREKAKASGSG